ncbi:MAG: glycine zipper family protein [Bacteroidota bacterium]
MKNLAIIFATSLLVLSCKNSGNEAGVTEASKQEQIDSLNAVTERQQMEIAKQKSIDSMQVIANQRQKTVVIHNTTPAAQTTTTVTPEAKRKGWSSTAKGAVIGAGVGAVGGAIINHKDRGTGAVIGGLAGAGLGAGAGAIIDAEKKRKAEAAAAAQQNP